MASSDLMLAGRTTEKLPQPVKLCTFCSNSTNGYDKWLYVEPQTKSPFFPILAQIRGEDTVYDESGKALVCIACFHHLLRQWSSFDRRCIPLQKREYTLIAEEKLSNFQIKREEEIRREGQIKLREIKLREEGIKKEAQERLERYKRREQQIKEEAEKRLLEEGAELQKIKREAERQLKEEREHEEKLKRSLEEDIRLEREKGEYIRREAERLLREDKFLSYPQPKPNLRTEFLIQSPQGRAYDQVTDQSHYNQNARYAKDLDDKMNPSRSKKMEYDPETGCYRRIVPLDFAEQKVEDIVKTEMNKAEVKMKLRSDKPAWKQAEDKEHGSNPDSSLEDLTLEASANEAETTPHYISGDSIKTEYKFTMKEEIQTESSPGGEEKNGEFADEEIRKAGEAIKAKFDEDRMKFEHDSGDITMSEREMTKRSYERRRRSSEDDPDRKKAREDAKERSLSLEKKIKDMEERRARMLRRSSGDHGDNDDSIKITRTITTETSHDKGNEATGSTRDESRSRRARMREERNRRRLASEGLVTETKPDDQSKATPVKSAGVKLELRSSSESYPGHSDASDITFTVKDPAEKKRESDSGEEKITSYTKTTKTVSLSGSLLDEPNVQSHTQLDDITFTVKESAHKKDVGDGEKATAEKSPRRDRVQEEEVKIEETEPVHSRFSGDFTQEEPDDIVFTVKKTTTTTAITSAVDSNKPEEPPKSVTREITLEERSFNPKTDLISWEEDIIDSGDKPLFRDYEPRKKREQVIADSSEYRGSLGRTELNRDHKRRRNLEHISGDSTDGYRGSLGRTDLNRVGSSSKGRNDLPPVILHDIESDFHEEQFVEPQKQMQVESAAPATSPMEEFEAPILYPHYQDKSLDDERRKRQLEIEEKQRQIMEKQQRASVKRREIPGTNKKTEDSPVPASSDNTEDLQEKRRSLLMMWESFAEGDGAGPENKLDEEQRRTSFGYEKMMTEASQSDPKALNSAGVVDYRIMDVEEENEEQRTPSVDIDEHHKLNDDELKWERAGQFQPGRLKTKFHELNEDDEPSADNIVFETKKTGQGSNNNTDESSSSYSIEQRYSYQAPIEEDQSYTVESAAKPLWDNVEDQSTHKDDDDNDEVVRRPHVDVDKENRLTEEEARWERAGHFQPGKINTSIFEGRKTADQTERVGSQKFKKSETRSYEQIKKIQRTDSKKEMLVPKKVTLRASDDDVSDVMEQDEYERPEVGKIDKSSLVYETMSDEERQRRERDERNRREMEEIQREREEERRRLEREDREAVTTINDFEDDEFDAKVKAKNVRKIDISKFGDFQKSPESVQENRPVSKLSTKRYSSEKIESHQTETVESTPTAPEEDDFELKVRHRMVGKLNIDSSPFKQHEASVKETSQPRKVQDQTCTYNEDIVVKEIPMEESAPPMEFENEEHNGRARSIRKLDKSRFSFSSDDKRSSPDQRPKDDLKSSKMNDLDKTPVTDDRKKKREREMREWEEDLKRDREQIDYVMKVHDNTFQSGLEGGSDIVTNDFENETRNIRKLDLSLFSKFKQEKDEPEAPVRKPSLKKEETYNTEEVVTIQSVKEVESIPDERSPEEDYELKRRSVGKLNMDWMSQMSQQDTKDSEQRRKETEMQRVKQEQYEIEKLRMEEMERGQMEGDDVFGNDVTDVPDKPQNVKRLDANIMSPYQKRGKSPDPVGGSKKKSKDEVRQERKLARKESRSKINVDEVLYVEEMPEVQQSPESFDGPQTNVGKLDKGRYLQMMGDDMSDKDRRKKQLEEERVRRELEEMERQREEEERRMNEMNTMEELSNVAVTDKPQNVNKLDLNQFSQFQQKTTVVENTRRRSVKKSAEVPSEKVDADEDNVRQTETIQSSVVQEVHSAPYYNDDIVIEEKPKNVGKLDFNKITKSFSDEAEEKQRRLVEREKERIRRENEERELLLLEQQRQRDSSPTRETEEYVLKETSLQEVQSAPAFFDDDEKQTQQSQRKSVGKLDFNKITKSFSDEAEEKRARLVEMEKERIRRENEEKEILLLEKQRQRRAPKPMKTDDHVVKETTVQEVHSAPTDFDDDVVRSTKYEEKPKKSVGKLDFDKITKSFSEEAEEKRRRLIELERERIIREREERELLLLEEERQRSREATLSRETEDHVVQETTVQEVHSAATDFDEDAEYERKRKTSIGKLDFNKITKSFSEEADEKRRRLVELEKNRIRRESEERELLLREQESQREGRTDVVKVNTVQEVQSVPENFDDEKSIDDKPKTVGKLDFEKITRSFSSEAEEKRRRLVEMEKERIRRESEEREMIMLEKQHQRQAPSSQKPEDFVVKETTVQEVHSAPTDFDDDEKYEQKPKKSVGKLDFDKITKSFGEEAEEKRRRLVERERERIRREKEEKDILLLEQQRQNESSSSVETRQNVVDEVQSTPTASKTGRLHNDRDSTIDREREEQYSVEEKRKSVSKLDIGNIMQSFREEDDMKRRRAMELEHDRRLRDEEEKNLSRLERQRAKNTSSTVQVSVAQEVHASASEDIFFEEKPTSSKPDLVRKDSEKSQEIQENHTEMQSRSTIRYEYDEDDGASQNKKAVGRLDLQRFSQSIDQETRERERRGRELEIERLRLERDEMEGRGVNQSTSSERADGHGDRSEGQSEESGGYSRPVPKRLDLSKFSAFQGGLRVTKDDTAIKRRDKSSGRQVRPKSIAGTSFKGVANGDAGYADIEYRIVK